MKYTQTMSGGEILELLEKGWSYFEKILRKHFEIDPNEFWSLWRVDRKRV